MQYNIYNTKQTIQCNTIYTMQYKQYNTMQYKTNNAIYTMQYKQYNAIQTIQYIQYKTNNTYNAIQKNNTTQNNIYNTIYISNTRQTSICTSFRLSWMYRAISQYCLLHIGCNAYHDLRTQYISTYYYRRPFMFKFIELFTTNNIITLKNLGCFW